MLSNDKDYERHFAVKTSEYGNDLGTVGQVKGFVVVHPRCAD